MSATIETSQSPPGLRFKLHADCIAVKGAARSAIYDLTRHRILSFATKFFPLLEQLHGISAASFLALKDGELGRAQEITALFEFLSSNELGDWFPETADFPPIDMAPPPSLSILRDAIVDVRNHFPDFSSICSQLDQLGCRFLQVRSYSDKMQMHGLTQVIKHAANTSIQGIETILPYSAFKNDLTELRGLIEASRLISRVILHSCPLEVVAFEGGKKGHYDPLNPPALFFIGRIISGADDCGAITRRTLALPTAELFADLKNFNGCLSGKISIDEDGLVRNCPSMLPQFGHIDSVSLGDVVNASAFRQPWGINKDQISVCRDCEFRYACTDCRAHVTGPDMHSKPAKCAYDPYIGEWVRAPERPSMLAAKHLKAKELI